MGQTLATKRGPVSLTGKEAFNYGNSRDFN